MCELIQAVWGNSEIHRFFGVLYISVSSSRAASNVQYAVAMTMCYLQQWNFSLLSLL